MTGAASADVRPGLLAVACTTQFLVVLDVSVMHVALPGIRADLGFSATGLQWVVTGYLLAFGGFLLFGGRLADLAGRRRALLAALAVFGAASLAGGLAWSAPALVAARAVQGLGAAVLSPISLTLVTTGFPDPDRRNRAIAAWAGVATAAGAAGVFAGGFVVEFLGWRWTLLANVPVVAAVLVAARRAVAPADGLGGRPDVLGVLLASGGLVAGLYGITAADGGSGPPAAVVTGVLLLCGFLAWEHWGHGTPCCRGRFCGRGRSAGRTRSCS